MSRSVDHIVLPRHHVKIPVLVVIPAISGVVVTGDGAEVLLDVFIVVVEDGLHERWRERLLEVDCTDLVGLADLTGGGVDYFYVETGERFAGRPGFLGESVET